MSKLRKKIELRIRLYENEIEDLKKGKTFKEQEGTVQTVCVLREVIQDLKKDLEKC